MLLPSIDPVVEKPASLDKLKLFSLSANFLSTMLSISDKSSVPDARLRSAVLIASLALFKEIADRLDISVKTVESQMRIAFQKIRESFKNEEIILWMLFGRLSGCSL